MTMHAVAHATDPLAAALHLPKRIASEEPETAPDVAMSSASMPRDAPSTMATSLEAAWREFMRLVRAAPVDDGALEAPIEVVIAREMTREAYDAIDDELLNGLVVELRDDGTFVLVEVLSNEHRMAKFEIGAVARGYAQRHRAQGLIATSDGDETNRRSPNNRRPSVVILQHMLGRLVPLVIFIVHVEQQSGSFRDLVREASFYFDTIPNLVRVVGVQFFQRHRGDPTPLQVPAVAVAFDRGDNFDDDRHVRILAVRSFGNWPLHRNVTNTLVSPPDDVPLDPYPDAARLREVPCRGALG